MCANVLFTKQLKIKLAIKRSKNCLNALKCKFISKPDGWFVEGTECLVEYDFIYPEYEETDTFNNAVGLFNGLTMESYEGYMTNLAMKYLSLH